MNCYAIGVKIRVLFCLASLNSDCFECVIKAAILGVMKFSPTVISMGEKIISMKQILPLDLGQLAAIICTSIIFKNIFMPQVNFN